MRHLKMWAVAAALVMVSATSSLSWCAPPQWSFSRASLGFDAKGAVLKDGAQTSAFLPGVYLSYSATSALSLAGTYERDFADHLSIGQAGMRFLVQKSERGQIGVGVNLVGYGDDGATRFAKPTSWNASLNGSWSAWREKDGQTRLWGIGSVAYDPENALTIARVGLRFQLIGGRPNYDQAQ